MFEVLSGCNVIGHGLFGSMEISSTPPTNYDNIEMEGIGSVMLPNSLQAPIERLELSGNSVQGYMIKVLPTELEQGTLNASNGQNFPSDYRVRTKDFISVEKGLYKITCEGAIQGNLVEYEENGTYKKTQFIAHTLLPWVVEFTEKCKVRITVSNGTEADKILIKPSDVKSITLQTEATLESPQEIVSAGKYDEVSGKYVIDVGVTGKNLFDISQYDKYDDTWTNTTYTTKKLKLKPNTTYTMSCKRLVDKPKQYVIFNILSGIKTGKAISVQINPSLQLNHFTGKGTFTTGETGEIVLNYYVDCPKGQYWFTEVIGDIQIELGSAQTDYEPYHEPQMIQLQLDEPLRGIGEYKDVITKDGILRKIKEIVLDENTGFETYWATLNKTFAFISPAIKDATVINGTPNRLLCNYFKVLPAGFDRTDEEVCLLFNRRFHVRFLKERNIDTVEKLKEWLKQNPIKIQYLLQEPVLEPFENSLENLHANDGTTVITVDSGEVETGIKLTYRKEK